MTIMLPPDLDPTERIEIERLLAIVETKDPALEDIWRCMDLVWDEIGCDCRRPDAERLARFYGHPVWLLNGLFIESHALSMQHRNEVSDWVAQQSVRRIAEFGGGYGTLARLIGAKAPRAQVEIIEPFPHPAAISKAACFANVRYENKFTGEYDMIIAMDVFEHVKDPLGLLYATARHLKPGALYLTANCFRPVIKCHLPSTFHFERSWTAAAAALGLRHTQDVIYGAAYRKEGRGSLALARLVEARSRVVAAIRWPDAFRLRWGLRTRLRKAFARIAN